MVFCWIPSVKLIVELYTIQILGQKTINPPLHSILCVLRASAVKSLQC